jgi:hypothetical protein
MPGQSVEKPLIGGQSAGSSSLSVGASHGEGHEENIVAPSKDVRSSVDRIPIRLRGGRRAWLEIPTPFYAADKERIKLQVDLLLTEEDERDF